MQYNKNIPRNIRSEHFIQGITVDERRCTGRTTGHLLSVIGEAMKRYGTPISYVENLDDTMVRIDMTTHELHRLIHKNELKHFTVNRNSKTLTYNVFTNNQWEIV